MLVEFVKNNIWCSESAPPLQHDCLLVQSFLIRQNCGATKTQRFFYGIYSKQSTSLTIGAETTPPHSSWTHVAHSVYYYVDHCLLSLLSVFFDLQVLNTSLASSDFCCIIRCKLRYLFLQWCSNPNNLRFLKNFCNFQK